MNIYYNNYVTLVGTGREQFRNTGNRFYEITGHHYHKSKNRVFKRIKKNGGFQSWIPDAASEQQVGKVA
jgi:hypothetical protein